jgi:thiamine biosynthesis lipoprotein ApbE
MLGFAIDSIDEITCDDRIREEALLVIWLPSLEVDFGGIAKLFLVKKKKHRAYALWCSQT